MASCCMPVPGRSSMALFTRTVKLDPGSHGARCAWAMAVHHAVGISHQRNSGYRPSRVNIMAEGLSTPDPSLSPIHLSIRRGRATTTHYTHRQVSLMVSCNTTLVPSLGRPQRWHANGVCATPNKRERKKKRLIRCYLDRRWRIDRLNTLINKISTRSLNLLIFAIGWAVCGWPQPGHESMMSVLSFSLFNV